MVKKSESKKQAITKLLYHPWQINSMDYTIREHSFSKNIFLKNKTMVSADDNTAFYSQLFSIANNSVLPFWILLFVFPHYRVTHLVYRSMVFPLCLSIVYIWLLFKPIFIDNAINFMEPLTLEVLQPLMSDPRGFTGGWVHYLAFDAVCASIIFSDSRRNQMPHVLVLPCLIFTLLAGPIGLFLYFLLRLILLRKIQFFTKEDESEEEEDVYSILPSKQWISQPRIFLRVWFGTSSFWRRVVGKSKTWNKAK